MFLFGRSSDLHGYETDIAKAFLLGMRFDLTVLCYINAVPLLALWIYATIFRAWPRWGMAFTKYWYFTLLLTMSFFNLIDLGFYSFYQDRLNVLVFGFFEDDTIALIKTMWKNYPVLWMAAVLVIFAFLIWKALNNIFPKQSLKIAQHSRGLIGLLLFAAFVLNGIGARGSFSLFPLSEMDTGISKSPFINQLAFNSSRAFARAVELRLKTHSEWNSNLKYFGYHDQPQNAFADFFAIAPEQVPADPINLLRRTTPKNLWAAQHSPHVVFVLLESWGSYWMQFDQEPFNMVGPFSKYKQQDLFTDKVLSQTAATIGTLSALMAGLPHRYIGEFLSESDYLQAPFRTSPARIFKQSGYETRLVYGGNPGWREINKFARFQGYDLVDGENEIASALGTSSANLERHDWGIYDHDLWTYVHQILASAKKPQFIVVMTTSNHPPFQIPRNYKVPSFAPPQHVVDKYLGDKNIPEKRYATYRYALDSFTDFLNKLETSSYNPRTIVAATGDHAFWMINFSEKEQLQKNAVPAFLHLPKELAKGKKMPDFLTQIDLLNTIYDLALSEKEVWGLGQNIFSPQYHQFTFGAPALVIGESGGINPATGAYYNWTENKIELMEGTKSADKDTMARRYRGLMGLLDYYMRQEKTK